MGAILAAAIAFLSPQQGSQAIGPMAIEVSTTATGVNRVEFYVDGTLVGVARQAPYRIAHDFGTTLAAHEVTAKVYTNDYHSVESASINTVAAGGETMNVDLVEVPMRIRSSKPVTAADIVVKENGIDQTIRDIRADRGPARFVFVVDRSLSMGDGKLDAALEAIDRESKLLRAGDRADIILFNHNVMPPRPLAQRERVTPSGGTSLRDAVSSIPSNDRTYAIVITDGGDRNSLISEDEALEKISGTKLTLDAIILGSNSRFLDRAAKNTGGTVARANVSTVDRELRHILEDINSRYMLSYQSHGNPSGWRAIRIEPRRRDVEILNARKGYFAS